MSLNLTPAAVIKIKNDLSAMLKAKGVDIRTVIILGDSGFRIRLTVLYAPAQLNVRELLPAEVDGCHVDFVP